MLQIPRIAAKGFTMRGFRERDVEDLHAILQNPEVLRYFPPTDSPSLDKVKSSFL